MPIRRSEGVTPSERRLAELCDDTFLRLWSYPNPYKDDGKELCDLIVIFESTIFVFFDREKALSIEDEESGILSWERWKRRVIDKQIKTARGAERYLRAERKIFLDQSLTQELPFRPDSKAREIYKIIVAHGAAEACESFSVNNVYGSLAISYSAPDRAPPLPLPFYITMDKESPVHVLDTHNFPIVLSELDTIWDFTDYLKAKEDTIRELDALCYCGEEDLLAHYFLNYDESQNRHVIGVQDTTVDSVMVGEGEWKDFTGSEIYQRTKTANEVSYFWDELIQVSADHALAGRTLGHTPLGARRSAIHEMAKEPRFSRRAIAEGMIRSIEAFPENIGELARNISLMPSFYPEKRYVFLQLRTPEQLRQEERYRQIRQQMLEVACGAAKNVFPDIELVIGIAMDAPKFTTENSEDFLLMDCSEWTDEKRAHYIAANEHFGFFQGHLRRSEGKATRFVPKQQG